MFKEKYIETKNKLTIYTESIGDPNNPPIILIMGALNQGLFWYDSFCRLLSESNYFVIRITVKIFCFRRYRIFQPAVAFGTLNPRYDIGCGKAVGIRIT